MTIVDEPRTTAGVLLDLTETSEERRARERMSAAVAALGRGGAVLLCDDAEQPGRADLLFAAMHADRHLTAFAIAHTSGFRCRYRFLRRRPPSHSAAAPTRRPRAGGRGRARRIG
ncbi:MAG: hypothetical protein EOO27_22780 [Comamonadaceae bacterium]|nr:MAG: hypothetical protein EOO27_22780 [Comamonadaceae bacterium]